MKVIALLLLLGTIASSNGKVEFLGEVGSEVMKEMAPLVDFSFTCRFSAPSLVALYEKAPQLKKQPEASPSGSSRFFGITLNMQVVHTAFQVRPPHGRWTIDINKTDNVAGVGTVLDIQAQLERADYGDSGLYRCSFGEEQMDLTIIVKTEPIDETVLTINQDSTLQHINGTAGDVITGVVCQTPKLAHPAPGLALYAGHEDLRGSLDNRDEYTVVGEDESDGIFVYTMTQSRLASKDSGIVLKPSYHNRLLRCEASQLGEPPVDRSIRMYITAKPEIHNCTNNTFLSERTGKVVKVVVACQVNAHPKIRDNWYFYTPNQEEIGWGETLDGRTAALTTIDAASGQYEASLTLTDIDDSLGGAYSLYLSNELGQARVSITIKPPSPTTGDSTGRAERATFNHLAIALLFISYLSL